MEESNYSVALPLWQELLQTSPDDANINYNIGLSMLNSFDERVKTASLPYLEKAAQKTSANYDPYSSSEKNAPVFAFYYLGISQHLNYKFDEAVKSFETFQSKITKKNFLADDAKRRIDMVKYAKFAVENPVNIEVTNLGGKLNSEFPDYSPVVRIDESAIYFTSRRLRKDSSNINYTDLSDGMYAEDIYVSYFENDEWGSPELLNINTPEHEATINLSIDGKTLFIYKDDKGDGNLYYSDLISDSAGMEKWANPKKFGPNINSKAYETHVAMSPDGKKLFFVSNKEGGYGGKDIYYCNLLPTGTWAVNQNIGQVLNTSGDEDGVFIHPDGVTMYFSSNGHSSMGGYDIFKSVFNEDSNTWSEPENLGYPINSVDDDVFFVTTPDGKRGYFSSFKEKGYGDKDIYMIQLLDAKETGLTLYNGEFTYVDRMFPPEGAQVIITDNTTNDLIGIYTPRQRDGKFSAILIPNRTYHMKYESDGYQTYEENIFVPDDSVYQEIFKSIALKPVRVGKDGEVINDDSQTGAGAVATGKGVTIDLLDNAQKLLNSTTTDDAGAFNFEKLDVNKVYFIRVNSEESKVLENDNLVITNDLGGKMDFAKIGLGMYKYTPFKDNNSPKSYNVEARDSIQYPYSYPSGKELENVIVYFQKFFIYNMKDIDEESSEFAEFANDIAELIRQRGYANLAITSSASKVPTKTWGNNTVISRRRAYDTKALIERVMLKKGINPSQYNFVDINTLITGPEYKGDFLENKKVYEKFQYVRVFVR